MKYRCLALFALVFLLLPSMALALPGPRAYLVEQVQAHYESNGSAVGDPGYGKCPTYANPCRYGYVQVAPPNNADVLQYIRVNLSSLSGTNLEEVTAYKGALGNSTAYERMSIYVNTSDSDPDDAYEINASNRADIAPDIRINLSSISNWQGGYDLYDADNIYPDGSQNSENVLLLNFSITNPSSSKTLSGVNVTIQFNQTGGVPDAVGVTDSVGQTGGASATRVDTDSDTYYDQVTWTGDLGTSETAYVWFNVSITEGTNFNGNSMSLDGSDTDTTGYYDDTNTLTGRTISDRFSRGPIRQGIDLSLTGGFWNVRGYIRNMGTESPGQGDYLRYNVTGWALYEIDPATGDPMEPANQSGDFSGASGPILTPTDGRVRTTDSAWTGNQQWFNSSQQESSKPYYGVSFTWHVEWNTTSYYGYINTTYDLTNLYKIDLSNDKTLTGAVNPDTGGENITVLDVSTMMGHNSSGADFVEILSVVPARTTGDDDHGNWVIHEDSSFVVSAWYDGSWNTLSEGSDYTKTVTQPDSSGGTDGLVNVTISDVSGSSIGETLKNSEKINITFKVSSSSGMTTGDVYNFTGNCTMKTDSGTPITENFDSEQVSLAGKSLSGWKELIGRDVNHPGWIDGGILVEVVSTDVDDRINDIKFIDYVPEGTNLSTLADYKSGVTLRLMNCTGGCSWGTETVDVDFIITDNGTTTLPDGLTVHVFEFKKNSSSGWDLGNGEKINVTYTMNITSSGAYVLPTVISGFDPETGLHFSTTAIGSVYVDIPAPLLPLEIDEEDFSQAKWAVVNKPVLWMKDFEAYNPNSRPAEAKFSVNVFEDTDNGYVSYYNEYGEKIEEDVDFIIESGQKRMVWTSKVNPFESRRYEIRILTPPILEVDRNVEVLEKLPQKKVKVMMDVFLKSFSKEKYENVALNLPIGYEDLIQARDSFGRELQFSGGKDSSRIIVGDLEAGGMKSVNIIYKQSYPTIIVTPEKDEFSVGSPVGLNILVINGGDDVYYPYLEIEIYTPGMDVIESDILKISSMEPLEKTELTEEYFLPVSAPTGMYLATARFRENFATLASGTGQFFLTGGERGLSQTWGSILLMIVIIIMGYLSYNRLKSVEKSAKMKSQVI